MPSPTVTVLGSGSTGNAILLRGDQGALLMEAGFHPRTLTRMLAEAHVAPSTLGGIVVSHEHADHARGAAPLAQAWGVPILATPGTLRSLPGGSSAGKELGFGDSHTINGFRIAAFRVDHDAAEPAGFRIDTGDGSLGYLTDAGRLTPAIAHALRDCTTLLVEANHDIDLLEKGPYPAPLRARIRGGRGHLNNDECGTLLADLVTPDTRRVVLHHLSQSNNTPELACATAHAFLARAGKKPPVLAAAPPRGPFGPFPF